MKEWIRHDDQEWGSVFGGAYLDRRYWVARNTQLTHDTGFSQLYLHPWSTGSCAPGWLLLVFPIAATLWFPQLS